MSTQLWTNQGAQTLLEPPPKQRALRSAEATAAPAQSVARPAERPWWAGFNDLPSWAVSLTVHVVLLLLLASMTRLTILKPELELSSVIEEELDPEAYKFDTTVVDQVGNDSQINQVAPSQDAAQHVRQDPQEQLDERLDEELLDVSVPPVQEIVQPHEAEFLEQIDATGATEHPGGVEGAIDRLAFEIAGSLRERKTLVIWLFDASLSLKDRRDAIADRFENVYGQLSQMNVTGDGDEKALKTAVARFGQAVELLTSDPVDDVREVVELVRNIEPDESGKENVFAAVDFLAEQWPQYRRAGTKSRRNVMLIIVTDERGDDPLVMEDVIARVKRYGIKVYCVGNAAIFGQEKGYVTWTWENGDTEDLPVDQGPETAFAQRLQLPFWGGPSAQELERMSASFGPYALTRLCAETGGLFLIAGESMRGPRFDPAVMRNYSPDYRPVLTIKGDIEGNLAKKALVQAAELTLRERPPIPQLAFRADSDTVLRQEITEAQKPLALFDYHISQMLSLLEAGEKDRPKLASPRWRAAYDLAYGRVLAMRVRAQGYNVVLADMKSTPKEFSTPGNNQWRLMPSREITAGPQVRKLAEKATSHLSRVVDEHSGTPWAMLAERELGQPLGWEWREGRIVIPQVAAAGNDRNPLQLAEDEKKKEAMRKQAPQKPRVRPKL